MWGACEARLRYSFSNYLNENRIKELRDKGNEFLLKLYQHVSVLYLSTENVFKAMEHIVPTLLQHA